MLPYAYDKLIETFETMKRETREWDDTHFGDNVQLLVQVRDGVLSLESRGLEKFGYLPRIPYLIAKLDQPGIVEICFEQYARAPREAHNRNSVDLFDPSGRFYEDVMAYKATRVMTPALHLRFCAIRDGPMDDKVAEAPHAIGSRIGQMTPASRWPWDAASMRLPQTIQDKESIIDKFGGDFQKLWDGYGMILQKRFSKLTRPVRRTHRAILDGVYFFKGLRDVQERMDDKAHFTIDLVLKKGKKKEKKIYIYIYIP